MFARSVIAVTIASNKKVDCGDASNRYEFPELLDEMSKAICDRRWTWTHGSYVLPRSYSPYA
jgi:hypothetical protein